MRFAISITKMAVSSSATPTDGGRREVASNRTTELARNTARSRNELTHVSATRGAALALPFPTLRRPPPGDNVSLQTVRELARELTEPRHGTLPRDSRRPALDVGL